MTAYAIAHLHDVDFCADIVAYLQGIDETLAPFQGRFIIHGARADVVEDAWRGDLIVIAFPTLDAARAWYSSEAYQRILPLRRNHARGPVILIDGVDEPHKATDILNKALQGQPMSLS